MKFFIKKLAARILRKELDYYEIRLRELLDQIDARDDYIFSFREDLRKLSDTVRDEPCTYKSKELQELLRELP